MRLIPGPRVYQNFAIFIHRDVGRVKAAGYSDNDPIVHFRHSVVSIKLKGIFRVEWDKDKLRGAPQCRHTSAEIDRPSELLVQEINLGKHNRWNVEHFRSILVNTKWFNVSFGPDAPQRFP